MIITRDKDLPHGLQPGIVMIHDGVICFDGSYEEFKTSDSPIIRPPFDLMPELHGRPVTV